MKTKFLNYLAALALGLLAGGAPSFGQASAVTDIGVVIGDSGIVDTTWLGNVNASAVYTLRYVAGGYSGQAASTPPPPGMPYPSTSVSSVGTFHNIYSNTQTNRYFIRKRITAYYCASTYYWQEYYYEGYLINRPPVLVEFSATPATLLLMRQSTVRVNVTDDGNLTEVRLKYKPPGAATYVDSDLAGQTLWTGTSGSNVTLNFTRTYDLVGTWQFKLGATDTRVDNVLAVDRDLIQVLSITRHDPPNLQNPTNVYGTTYPALTNTVGSGAVMRAGQPALVQVEFTVAGVPAGRSVRVSVGAGGGKLFLTNAVIGAGDDSLTLTTNASGKVTAYYQVGSVSGGLAGVYALAGLSFAKLELTVGLAAATTSSNIVDTDGDGMPDRLETALGGGGGVAHSPASPVGGFAVFTP